MQSARELSLVFATAFPVEAARALEQLPPAEAAAYFADLAPETGAALLRAMAPESAAGCLAPLGDDTIVALVAALHVDDAAAVLVRLPPARRQALRPALPPRIERSLAYRLALPPTSVGAHVDARVPAFAEDTAAGEALGWLKQHADVESAWVYVLSGERRLRGGLRFGQLLAAPEGARLADLRPTPLPDLRARATLSSVLRHEAWVDHDRLPVVDHADRFLGVLHRRAFDRRLPAADVGSGAASWMDAFTAVCETWLQGVAALADEMTRTAPHEARRRGEG